MAGPNRRDRRRKGVWAVLLALLAMLRNQEGSILPFVAIYLTISITLAFSLPAPTVSERPVPTQPQPTQPVFPPRDSVAPGGPQDWATDTIPTYDDKGQAITFLIGTLNDNYRWLMGSSEYVGIRGRDTIPVTEALATLRPDFDQPLVLIGMASHENALEHPDDENARGQTRVDVMAQFAENHFTRHPTVYKVNLGAYTAQGTASSNSAVERRVVVLQVTCLDRGADIREGMSNALAEAQRRGNTSVDGRRYSNFGPGLFSVTVAAVGRRGNPPPPECHRSRRPPD